MKGKAIARLTKELKKVQDEMPPNVLDMHMQESNMHELFFAFSGPADTPHAGGVYVLKIQLPKTYPFAPPDFFVMTPNGRFNTNTKICMTFSSFHPETWTPSYTLTTLLVSFVSFFAEERSNAIGVVYSTPQEKKQFAKDSVAWCQRHSNGNKKYSEMLPIFSHLKAGLQTEATIKAAVAKRHPQLAAAVAPDAVDVSAVPASTAAPSAPASKACERAVERTPVRAAGALQPLSPAQQNVARQASAQKRPNATVDLSGSVAPAPAKKARSATVVLDDDEVVLPAPKAQPPAQALSACVDLT